MTDDVLMTDEGVDRRVRIVTRWLENVSRTVERTFDFDAQAKAFRAKADNLRGMDYSAVHVKSSLSPDAIPNAIIAADEMGELFEGLSGSASARLAKAQEALDAMENQGGARALNLYYLAFDANGKRKYDTWEKVCVEMSYTYDGMMKLVRRAKLELYDHMPHTERPKVESAI